MISLQSTLYPLIRVMRPEINVYKIRELVEDYIHEQAMPTYRAGEIVPAVDIIGQSLEHASMLSKYLNKHNAYSEPFEVIHGYFCDHMIDEHHWLQAEHLIIDICIQKFKNYPQIDHEIVADLAAFSYLICDNPHDPIHRLYFECT